MSYDFSKLVRVGNKLLIRTRNNTKGLIALNKNSEPVPPGPEPEPEDSVVLFGKTYKAKTINGIKIMTEDLAYDDGLGGIVVKDGYYYYTYDAAIRIADSIADWTLPNVSDFNVILNDTSKFSELEEGEGEFSWENSKLQDIKQEDGLNMTIHGYYDSDGTDFMNNKTNYWTCEIYKYNYDNSLWPYQFAIDNPSDRDYVIAINKQCIYDPRGMWNDDYRFSIRLVKQTRNIQAMIDEMKK